MDEQQETEYNWGEAQTTTATAVQKGIDRCATEWVRKILENEFSLRPKDGPNYPVASKSPDSYSWPFPLY